MTGRIVFASGNPHKAGEIEGWFRARGQRVTVEPAACYGGMDGCAETAEDFAGNARIKAVFLRSRVPEHLPVLADDSGLEVDALGGAPGVRSARFAGEGAGDAANRGLLLRRLRGVPGAERTARFVCVLAWADAERAPAFYRGECEGRILPTEKGNGGFGYDPVFAPTGSDRSFAEFDPAAKQRISHRGRALEALEKALTDGRGNGFDDGFLGKSLGP